jgi:L,D-peptidoglycan transpeptidase YkuD (ErfK/YbiS/YcfS/YnhG family)
VTLAPREERTYSRKVTTSTKRRLETKEKARARDRTEEQTTQRAVKDIVETAERRTGLEASGSYGAAQRFASRSTTPRLRSTRARTSARRWCKAASEYESDRSVDVSFETSTEITLENTGKLTNPNDELAVTFLFYQLQRRYHVSASTCTG